MSIFNEFNVATEATCKANWSCGGPGVLFFCAFCGHKFVPGDLFRMTYTNDMSGAGGNPLTCEPCDKRYGGVEGVRKAWADLWEEYRTRFKWFHARD